MRQLYIILLFIVAFCTGCQWQNSSSGDAGHADDFTIERYDRVESLYLLEADFAALQQMKTEYPVETRMLIEDVLQIGAVDEPDINTRFLMFFQDSTLQTLLADVERQFESMDDIDRQLGDAFSRLQTLLPDVEVPRVYTQIGSLDQSVTVGDGMLGVSLDKYLGADHPLYQRYGYSETQRSMMTREYIVPDCLGFYLLSLYPQPADTTEAARFRHMGRIQHVVNQAMQHRFFTNEYVHQAETLLSSYRGKELDSLLRN